MIAADFDARRAVGALVLLITALFLLSGQLPSPFAALARRAAAALFAVVFAGILVYVGLWLFGVRF